MSETFYAVFRDDEQKRLLIIDIGSSLEVYGKGREDIELIYEWLKEIDEILEEVGGREVVNLTVEDVSALGVILRRLLKLKYDVDFTTYGDLVRTLQIWGLVSSLLRNPDVVFMGVYGEYSEFIDGSGWKKYEDEGYTIWWW